MGRTTSEFSAAVFFDGSCRLCCFAAEYYYHKSDHAGRLRFVNIASAYFRAEAYGLDPSRVEKSLHVKTADGQVHTAAADH
jgi:predicted DCC family thiol-disulfide oxidoreductase YuxK